MLVTPAAWQPARQAQAWLTYNVSQEMNCPRCSKEMEEGSCYTGQTGFGFLFAGLALPHLFFQALGKKKKSVTSWNAGACRSFHCSECEATIIYPDEPGI
ncbi:MAG: PF20097 family protein [Nibricoccus sp.]